MGKINITKVKDDIFGNMVHVTNGIVELTASLDFGPRIMRYSFCGKDNILYNDVDKKPLCDQVFDVFADLPDNKIRSYGGHRLWVSPEILPRCYYPDNQPVTVTETSHGICLTAPVEAGNDIQKSIEIELNEYNSEVVVVNTIKNTGAWDKVFAPWAITVMAQGGVEVIPMPARKTGYLANRYIGLWDYTKMNDDRVYFGEDYIILRQDVTNNDAFKIGINNETGAAAYFLGGQLFIKRYNHVMDAFYPDFTAASYETYTNAEILEMETLAPTQVLEPGKEMSHVEKWGLYEEELAVDAGGDKKTLESAVGVVLGKYL